MNKYYQTVEGRWYKVDTDPDPFYEAERAGDRVIANSVFLTIIYSPIFCIPFILMVFVMLFVFFGNAIGVAGMFGIPLTLFVYGEIQPTPTLYTEDEISTM